MNITYIYILIEYAVESAWQPTHLLHPTADVQPAAHHRRRAALPALPHRRQRLPAPRRVALCRGPAVGVVAAQRVEVAQEGAGRGTRARLAKAISGMEGSEEEL